MSKDVLNLFATIAFRVVLALTTLTTGVVSPTAAAQFDLSIIYSEPVDLPGFEVVTFTIESERPLIAVEGLFQGPMNQVNPADSVTIFNDLNTFFGFVGADPSQDSQFLLSGAENFGAQMLIPVQNESDSELFAAFTLAGETTYGLNLPLAQIVIPNDGPGFAWDIKTVVEIDDELVLFEQNGFIVPEPTTTLVGLVGGGAWLTQRKRPRA